MKLVTFRGRENAPELGVLRSAEIVPLAELGFRDMPELIAQWTSAQPRVEELAAKGEGQPLSSVKLMAPVPKPNKLICIGLNYREHAIESNMAIPEVPTVFSKFATAIVGPEDSVVLPSITQQPDYEAEFAFIVGKGGRNIPESEWRNHVFGYTIVNDVSARDLQLRVSQWLMGKSFDTFAPMGPAITTADEIADPHTLDIRMTINGEVLQNSNTSELIFNLPALVAYLSSVFTLEPGDVVATGTPSGVGMGRNPKRWLRPGDEMTVFVQGLGELRNRCVAEAEAAKA
jgi:2-keto-4-pentenoate hydratase/2-oxohepta-3-ene-1,7-dioic acid hydratase in catechol pathway